MNPIRALNLDHVVLRVVDVERMVGFYRDVIGCTLERVNPAMGLTQLRAGVSLIDLVSVDGPIGSEGGAAPGAERRNVDHFCFRVEAWDERALLDHLSAHAVEPGEVKERYGADGFGLSMYIRDPEGNRVELKGPPTRQLGG
ncbi:MAG: VOC family protein [Proteobacteria bacterium]|nr:VOC family protein [Burkholderiales bacterium]